MHESFTITRQEIKRLNAISFEMNAVLMAVSNIKNQGNFVVNI